MYIPSFQQATVIITFSSFLPSFLSAMSVGVPCMKDRDSPIRIVCINQRLIVTPKVSLASGYEYVFTSEIDSGCGCVRERVSTGEGRNGGWRGGV